MIVIFFKLSKSLCLSAFLASFFSFEKELVLIYMAIAVHECAHLIACLFTKEKHLGIVVNIFGMSLICKPIKKLSNSMIVLFSGPVASFVLFFVFSFVAQIEGANPYMRFFAFVNLSIGTANLLPVVPLDGGNIIKGLLHSKLGVIAGERISQKISGVFRIFFVLAELICILCKIFNPSAFVFVIFLIASRKKEKELAIYDKKCILSGDTPKNKKIKYMSFDSESELLAIAEKISHSYFLIVAAFENGKFVGDIDERELLFAIRKNSSLCTLKEYFEDKCL